MPLMYSGDGSQPRQDTRLAPVTHAEELKMWRAAKTTANCTPGDGFFTRAGTVRCLRVSR